jgi:hypothetical protein
LILLLSLPSNRRRLHGWYLEIRAAARKRRAD